MLLVVAIAFGQMVLEAAILRSMNDFQTGDRDMASHLPAEQI